MDGIYALSFRTLLLGNIGLDVVWASGLDISTEFTLYPTNLYEISMRII
jgi:hypothetical protein